MDAKKRLLGSPDARSLMRRHPPIDLHADTLMWARWIGYDIAKRHTARLPESRWLGHVDIPRLADGLMGGQFFGLVTLPLLGTRNVPAIKGQVAALAKAAEANPRLVLCRSAQDVERARLTGKIAGLLGVEGAHALDGDVHNVALFAELGVRYLGLAHFSANKACFPAKGAGRRDDLGLTEFGRQVVAACHDCGIIIDLAHINARGFDDAAAASKGKPLIVSHTGVAGAFAHWRNASDAQLKTVADSGGVVGIIFVPGFLGGDGLEPVLRHMEHVINLVGEEHVALGSDYDGMVVPTRELAEVHMMPNLVDAMLRAKWPERRIGRVLRDNVLRVLRSVPVPRAFARPRRRPTHHE